MSISAVNCTPIKPQVSFKGDNQTKTKGLPDYDTVLSLTDKVNDEFVQSSDIKSPVTAAVSIGLAALVAFATGKKIGNLVSKIATKAPDTLVNTATKGGQELSKLANSLKGADSGKLAQAKKLTGKVLGSAHKYMSKAYHSIASIGIEKGANPTNANTFSNIFGIAGLATIFPTVVTKDSNGDGVKDILQKGQNAYTGTKSKMNGALEKARVLSELAEAVM